MEDATVTYVQCHHAEGSRYIWAKANNRNHRWADVCCELIDNANMAAIPGIAATVVIEWGGCKGERWFSVYDDGQGASDLAPFFDVGVSRGRDIARGASTFGAGLFGVECVVDGIMTVATIHDGRLHCSRRQVAINEDGYESMAVVEATDANCVRRGMPATVGTQLLFSRIKKTTPTRPMVQKMAAELGATYGQAIRSGELRITLKSKGEAFPVMPESALELIEAHEQTPYVNGHLYRVKWGVTAAPNRDQGMRLMYGGKLCGVTAKPCGEYALDRFYAELEIPRSIGRDSMDIFKRAVDDEVMSPVYDELSRLFDDALAKAHGLSQNNKFQSLNDAIKDILCGKRLRPLGSEGAGDREERAFNGRDPNGTGVTPVNSARTRSGNKGGKRNRGDSLDVKWAPLGPQPLCKFDVTSSRLTFNSDDAQLASLRDSQDKMAPLTLAVIAAGYMAFALKSEEGYGGYDWQFRKNIRWREMPVGGK